MKKDKKIYTLLAQFQTPTNAWIFNRSESLTIHPPFVRSIVPRLQTEFCVRRVSTFFFFFGCWQQTTEIEQAIGVHFEWYSLNNRKRESIRQQTVSCTDTFVFTLPLTLPRHDDDARNSCLFPEVHHPDRLFHIEVVQDCAAGKSKQTSRGIVSNQSWCRIPSWFPFIFFLGILHFHCLSLSEGEWGKLHGTFSAGQTQENSSWNKNDDLIDLTLLGV